MAQARRTSIEAIIEAAAKVFSAKGYRQSTVDDIAEAAGISRPTLYQYAESKPWLLEQIAQMMMADMQTAAEEIATTDCHPVARLRLMIDSHIKMSIKYRVYYGILLAEETELSPKMQKRHRAWRRERTHDFYAVLEACAQLGLTSDDLDLTVASNLINSAMNSLYRWYRPSGPVRPAELAGHVMQLLSGWIDIDQPGA